MWNTVFKKVLEGNETRILSTQESENEQISYKTIECDNSLTLKEKLVKVRVSKWANIIYDIKNSVRFISCLKFF